MSDGVKSWQGKVRHGTQSGYRTHQNEGSDPCEACVAAKREYDARWKAIPENTQRNRLAAAAQRRAYVELVHRHTAEYHAIYDAIADAMFADAGLTRHRYKKRLTHHPTSDPSG